jgi:hypothetical protein
MIDEADLAELKSTVLTGVTVGVGSQILIFGSGATIIVQCHFCCENAGREQWGHGEEIYTSALLFDFFNHRVEDALLEDGEILVLKFEGEKSLRIIPERNGLESYVVTTRFGICPVVVV